MMKRGLFLLLVAVALSVGQVFAYQHPNERLNTADASAPASIYYSYATLETGEEQYTDLINGIQIWSADSMTGTGQEVLSIAIEDVQAAIAANPTTDFQLTAQNGYGLIHSASGWFWATTPSGYSFVWPDTRALSRESAVTGK